MFGTLMSTSVAANREHGTGRLGRIPNGRDRLDLEDVGGRRTESGVIEPALEGGVLHDVDTAVQTELSHGVGFVRFDGLDADR